MIGTVYDVPITKKCCTNCEYAFINPRKELNGIGNLGKFPLCTCQNEKNRRILQDPRKESCPEFSHK